MKISIIVAAAENNVIGVDNDLPWKLPDDMKFFVQTTKGHHILGGRKNFESFGKALPNRTNMIISRNADYKMEGAITFTNIQDAIKHAKSNGEEELMVIGGGEIYRQALDQANTIYLTRIHTEIIGDVYFPALDREHWELKEEKYHPKDEKHAFDFTFEKWERIRFK
jgi:dihydrofolate reductase